MYKFMNREILVTLQIFLVFLSLQLPSAGTVSNIAYEVTGTLQSQTFSYLDGQKFIQASNLMQFRVEVGPAGWLITMHPPTTNKNDAIDFRQDGTDGTTIYSLSHINQERSDSENIKKIDSISDNNVKSDLGVSNSGTKKGITWNKAVSTVYKSDFPMSGVSRCSPIWLAYASQNCLKNATDHKLPKLWGMHVVNTNKLKSDWECYTKMPQLPLRIRFYNEGKRFVEIDKAVKSKVLKPPFDQGYLEAQYDAIGTIESGVVCVPKYFIFQTFVPVPGASNTNQVAVFTRVEGETFALCTVTGKQSYIPSLTVATAVQDYRPRSSGPFIAEGVQYRVSSNWLSESNMHSLQEYKRRTSKQQNTFGAESIISKKRLTLFIIFCLTIITTVSVGIWRVTRKT